MQQKDDIDLGPLHLPLTLRKTIDLIRAQHTTAVIEWRAELCLDEDIRDDYNSECDRQKVVFVSRDNDGSSPKRCLLSRTLRFEVHRELLKHNLLMFIIVYTRGQRLLFVALG